MLEILSLGAGVQSSAVFLMSCRGELPRLDHAIFSDTQWEPPRVYDWLETLMAEGQKAGIPIHVVTGGDLRAEQITARVRGKVASGQRFASLPFRTVDRETGSEGMIRRQCTREYKIDPIEKEIRRLMGLVPRQRFPKVQTVRQWFGISLDEVQRMRSTADRWRTFWYPLIEGRMTRGSCLTWLDKAGYKDVPRSACIGCPFHSNAEWRAIKADPAMWADAVEFDEAIRDADAEMRGRLYLHRDCVPLKDADLRSGHEDQIDLWNNECEGMCGV